MIQALWVRAAHSAGALNINFASGHQTPSTSSQCRGTKRFTVIVPLPRNIHKSRLLFNKVPSDRSTGKKHQTVQHSDRPSMNKLPSSNSRDTTRFVKHTGHLSDFTRETPTQKEQNKGKCGQKSGSQALRHPHKPKGMGPSRGPARSKPQTSRTLASPEDNLQLRRELEQCMRPQEPVLHRPQEAQLKQSQLVPRATRGSCRNQRKEHGKSELRSGDALK